MTDNRKQYKKMETKIEKSNKILRKEATIFSERFLSVLLGYLNMKDITEMDSAICNKSDREKWLECIAKDIGSVSTKIQPYLTNDQAIEWCFKRNVKFKSLHLVYLNTRPCSISTRGAALLAKCCPNITELQVHENFYILDTDTTIKEMVTALGQQCFQLKKVAMESSVITDSDITSLLTNNHGLEEIEMISCKLLTDACLNAFADNNHQLHSINFKEMTSFTDQGIAAVVSNNHDLQAVELEDCKSVTDTSLIAIADNCHKLKKVDIANAALITDQGIVALVSSNHDLEEINLDNCELLTDNSLIAIAEHCHKFKKVNFDYRHLFTNRGFMTLMSSHTDCEEISVAGCRLLTDECLIAIGANNCHQLQKVCVTDLNLITDQGIAAVVTKNHNLEEIQLDSSVKLTDVGLIAIADNCHKLKTIDIANAEGITNQGFVALVSSNHDLENIILKCPSLTDEYLNIIASHCHKLRTIYFGLMGYTDEGMTALVSNNHNLEEISLVHCMPISNASLIAIADNCPILKNLFIANVSHVITAAGCRYFTKRCRAAFTIA